MNAYDWPEAITAPFPAPSTTPATESATVAGPSKAVVRWGASTAPRQVRVPLPGVPSVKDTVRGLLSVVSVKVTLGEPVTVPVSLAITSMARRSPSWIGRATVEA